MQQPPNGYPPGGPPPQPGYGGLGAAQGPPPARKPSTALIAALVAGGIVVVVFLGLALRWGAQKQEEDCAAAVEKTRAAVAKNGAASAREYIEATKKICKSLRREEIAALEGTATTPSGAAVSTGRFVAESQSVIGSWEQVITNPAMPNSVASDSMRHVFRPDGTVSVRMDEAKPATFKWTFEQGNHVVAYKFGQFDHPRQFRLRSADEADVVESNGNVLDTYVREGSAIAQRKSAVSIFAQVAASKNAIDVEALVVGRSYVLGRQTALMPDPDPVDPTAALALVKNIPAGSSFSVVGKRTVAGTLWYQVRTAVGGTVTGWFNSGALMGQDIRAK
jgi:hypothetical protein